MDYLIIGVVLIVAGLLMTIGEKGTLFYRDEREMDDFIHDHRFVDEMEDKYESLHDMNDDDVVILDDRRKP